MGSRGASRSPIRTLAAAACAALALGGIPAATAWASAVPGPALAPRDASDASAAGAFCRLGARPGGSAAHLASFGVAVVASALFARRRADPR